MSSRNIPQPIGQAIRVRTHSDIATLQRDPRTKTYMAGIRHGEPLIEHEAEFGRGNTFSSRVRKHNGEVTFTFQIGIGRGGVIVKPESCFLVMRMDGSSCQGQIENDEVINFDCG